MSSIYNVDRRSSLSYDNCLSLTLENDGAKMFVLNKDTSETMEPPEKYDGSLSYVLTDGKNYLHIGFSVARVHKRTGHRVSCATSYGGNQTEDLLDILGKSKWVG